MTDRYQDVIERLRVSYDASVEERSRREVAAWKVAEWERFLEHLRAESMHTLLEVGAGTGAAASFFANGGLDVTCTDLSPAMVAYLAAAGLRAAEADVLELGRFRDFDAAFSMNCLLHVPRDDLVDALAEIRRTLRPSGLAYLGQYGGVEYEGVFPQDTYEPKRYFSWLTDEQLLLALERCFEVVTFERVDIGSVDGSHFQAAIVRA